MNGYDDSVFHRVNEDGSLTDLSGCVSTIELVEISEPHYLVTMLPAGQLQTAARAFRLTVRQAEFLADVLHYNASQMRRLARLFDGPTPQQQRIAEISTRKYRARKGRR